jgi:hypothetical protein
MPFLFAGLAVEEVEKWKKISAGRYSLICC